MIVGFCGARALPVSYACSVGALVRWALSSGAALAVGCATGADALVMSTAVDARQAARLSVFCAFGPGGEGAIGHVSAVQAVEGAAAAGAAVHWWSGGGAAVPVRGRLAQRSLALVRALAPDGQLVGFVDRLPPAPFGPGPFPSCGSGSWSTLAAAALLGVGVVVVPCGVPADALPLLPGGGAWVPGSVVGSWAWVPAQLSLF